jgi:hypothetical protein
MLLEECLQAIVEAAMAQDGVIHAHNLGTLEKAADQATVAAQQTKDVPNKTVHHTMQLQFVCW